MVLTSSRSKNVFRSSNLNDLPKDIVCTVSPAQNNPSGFWATLVPVSCHGPITYSCNVPKASTGMVMGKSGDKFQGRPERDEA
jgi:hypothetical protein